MDFLVQLEKIGKRGFMIKTVKDVLERYSYHLPSTDSQLKEFAKEIQEAILKEIDAGVEGVVINGVLHGAVTKIKLEEIKEKLEKDLE